LIKTNAGSWETYPILTLENSTAEVLRVQADGNVGIGTSSPSYTLDVSGTANIGSSLYISANERFNISGALIPHTVSSTTKFTNLNADLLDGHHYSSNWDADTSTTNELQNLQDVYDQECGSGWVDMGSYCIQYNEAGSGSYYTAANACWVNYHAHLCTPSEWYAACAQNKIINRIDDWEQTSTIYYDGVSNWRVVMNGSGSCSSFNGHRVVDGGAYRCCK
jgi:hypothetical protein